MQLLSDRALSLLLHLGLLAVTLAVFFAVSGPRGSSADGSYATSVSAFHPGIPRSVPQLRQPHVRKIVDATFAGVPQRGVLLGDPDAPVTMQFLADPECPQARQFAVQLLPQLVRRWVRNGKLRIEYLGEPAETIWPKVFERQQVAVLAAGKQGRLWQYLEYFYHYQGPEFHRYAENWFLTAMARETRGLDMDRWEHDRHHFFLSLAGEVRRFREIGFRDGVHATPAFFVGPTGGRLEPLLHFTLTEPLAFEAAFREALAA